MQPYIDKHAKSPIFKQVCIIGLGLIGASLAQAIRNRQLSTRIVAVDRNLASIEAALAEDVIDAGAASLQQVVAGSDCIVIAIPVKAVGQAFVEIQQAMHEGLISTECVISDVCSTKKKCYCGSSDSFWSDIASGICASTSDCWC